jgi:hypothetical protein
MPWGEDGAGSVCRFRVDPGSTGGGESTGCQCDSRRDALALGVRLACEQRRHLRARVGREFNASGIHPGLRPDGPQRPVSQLSRDDVTRMCQQQPLGDLKTFGNGRRDRPGPLYVLPQVEVFRHEGWTQTTSNSASIAARKSG